MEVRILGAFEVATEDSSVTPRGRGEQELLAMLAMRPGRVVATEHLIDALWGESLPTNPANALQLRVSKLRKALTTTADRGDLVATHARGYSLELPPDAVDAHRFTTTVAEARRLRADGLVADAVASYRDACGVWRGPALIDFLEGAWAPAEARLLENLRLAANEECLALELDLGRHAEVLSEIESIVRDHPFREPLHALHMTALYRCGQQAEALAAYAAARRQLADELGIDPSPELQALEGAILRHDPDLAPPSRSRSPARTTEADVSPSGQPTGAPFVGRRRELAVLEAAVDRARHGRAQVVLLTGEAGIGKTTLARRAAAATGVRLLVGRCTQLATDCLPLAPVADLVRTVARHDGGLGNILESRGLSPLATLAPSLFPETAPPAAAPTAQVFDSFLRLLDELGTQCPTMVLLEDLHWTDRSTWDLLAFVARSLESERVVIIATFRNAEGAADAHVRRLVAELARLGHVTRTHLTGLDHGDIATQVHHLLGVEVSTDVLHALIERSAGNPFFVEQLTAVLDSGEGLPPLLSDLIDAELEALPEPTRRLLALVSTCGGHTRHKLLMELEDDLQDLDAHLQPALDAGVLVVTDDDSYTFRHALLGDVADRRLRPTQRALLHRRVAQALERAPHLGLDAPGGVASEIAHHWERAGEPAKALPHALAAADAVATLAPATAMRQLDLALRLSEQLGKRGGLDDASVRERSWQIAELAFLLGDGEQAVARARQALDGDRPRPGHIERLARYLWTAGRATESAVAYVEALDLIDATTPPLEAASVHAGIAQGEYLSCRYASTAQHAEAALHAIADVPSGPEVAHVRVRALSVLGASRAVMGDPDTGIALALEAMDLAAATRDGERYVTPVYVAEALSAAGRDSDAAELLIRQIPENRRLGLDRSYGGYIVAMGVESLIRLGRWSQAADLLTGFTARDAVPVTHLRLVAADALLAARMGQTDRAQLLVDGLTTADTDEYHRRLCETVTIEVALARGNAAAALTAVRRAWDRIDHDDRRSPARLALLYVRALAQTALLRDGGPLVADPALLAEATAIVETAAERSRGGGHDALPEARAHLADAQALVAELAHDADPDLWSQAARAWGDIGHTWQQAVALRRESATACALGQVRRGADAMARADRLAEDFCWHAAPTADIQPSMA